MSAKIEFFPVGNGDMTLLTLQSGKKILIDVRICDDDITEDTNVVEMLHDRLDRDENNRLYVDAFLLTHPDQDHTLGLAEYFHLGPLDGWKGDQDKIVIREMWSSPIIFRRKGKLAEQQGLVLCDDALAWWSEARRRVQSFIEGRGSVDGERILILGDDIDQKTEGLDEIRVLVGGSFNHIGGVVDDTFSVDLLGPLPIQDQEDEEEALAKNRSSVICRFHIVADGRDEEFLFLTGGDAEVLVWNRLWQMHQSTPEIFQYDLLQTPHHCSIHSLSEDSWSDKGDELVIDEDARSALSQAKGGARIVASCKPISDDDSDPPCIRAKQEYDEILKPVGGEFVCSMTHQGNANPEVLTITIGDDGSGSKNSYTPTGSISTRLNPPSREFEKSGGGRYA